MLEAEQDRAVRPEELTNRAGLIIAARRLAQGLTQEELRQRLAARGWRCSRTTITTHEGGGTLTVEQLARYADALQCLPRELLDDEGGDGAEG